MVEASDLKGYGIFSGLDQAELGQVARLATVEEPKSGTRIIREGTDARALYLLARGRVAVRMNSRDGHEVLIDELGPGDIFGWSAVLDDHTFKAAIWAVDDSTVIALDGAKLKRLFEENTDIGYRAVRMIAAITASRLENLRARLVDQPFSAQYLTPPRVSRVFAPSSETRTMPCPECSVSNHPFAIVNETEQYRCKSCGISYYSPLEEDKDPGAGD